MVEMRLDPAPAERFCHVLAICGFLVVVGHVHQPEQGVALLRQK
jgi:hypothetical protein